MKKVLISVIFLACLIGATFTVLKLYGYYHIYSDGKKEHDSLKEYIYKNKYDEEQEDPNNNEKEKITMSDKG